MKSIQWSCTPSLSSSASALAQHRCLIRSSLSTILPIFFIDPVEDWVDNVSIVLRHRFVQFRASPYSNGTSATLVCLSCRRQLQPDSLSPASGRARARLNVRSSRGTLVTFRQSATMLRLRLSYCWKRAFLTCLTLAIGGGSLLTFLWDEINELPDRWHFPLLNPEPASPLRSPTDVFQLDTNSTNREHPISTLITSASQQFEQLLAKQTHGVSQAAKAYRIRRRRHPPPLFDQWVRYAEAHGCLMIEEHFDRIYHDLNPFWGVSPDHICTSAAQHPVYIRIRKGKVTRSEPNQPFVDSYLDLIQQIAQFLPDTDIPINHMDEPRVLIPWKLVSEYMKDLESSFGRQDLEHMPRSSTFANRSSPRLMLTPAPFVSKSPYWNLVRQACPPDSEARTLDIDSDFSTPPIFPDLPSQGIHQGYVQNWTLSQDVCHNAHLRNMHGTFVEPVSISTATDLIPIFSGSKLLMNNDILVPGAIYWTDKDGFAPSKHHVPWRNKRNEVFWRGTASGGRNTVDNWIRFQRHRLVSILNGTQVEMTLKASGNGNKRLDSDGLPYNFPIPDQSVYHLVSAKLGLIPDWIRSFSNVAFYWLECFPSTRQYGCSYTGSWYRRGRPVPLERMFLNKYLPDVDGNSYSGRFRAFLMSSSLPIKATIYTEWHDSRLIPWKHFVPMDNTFIDLWGILEFFLSHDNEAEKIALEGRKWAERVLRQEDMLVYVYRLLLEYARVVDSNRDDMGYGQNLVEAAAPAQ
jgi:hypothetical protein